MSFSTGAGLLFTYGLAPLAVFVAAMRALREDGRGRWMLLALAFGLAPACISRFLTWLLYLLPGFGDWLYLTAIVVVFALLAVYGRLQLAHLPAMWREAGACLGQRPVAIVAAIVAAAGFLALILAANFGDPGAALASKLMHWGASTMLAVGHARPEAYGLFVALLAATLTLALPSAPQPQPAITGSSRTVMIAGLAGIAAALLAAAVLLILGRPLVEADATGYYKVATLLYEAKSLAHFPMVPAAPDGTYSSTSHPLGHYGLLIWSFMLNGSPAPGVAKLGAIDACLATLGGIAVVLARYGAVAALASTVVLLTTPAYLHELVDGGIDPQRLMLTLMAFIALLYAARRNNWPAFVFAGLAAGLAVNSHSQSMMVVPLIIAVILAVALEAPWPRRGAAIVAVGTIAALIGGERLVLNLMQFGSPVVSYEVIWNLVPEIDHVSWRESRVVSPDLWGRLISTPLLGFTWPAWFGLSWWMALLAVAACWPTIRTDRALLAIALVLGAVVAMLCFFFGFTAMGHRLVMNYRYAGAVQPFVAVLAGLLIERLTAAHGMAAHARAVVASLALVSGMAAVVGYVVMPAVADVRLGRLDRSRFEELAAMPTNVSRGLQELGIVRELRAITPADSVFLLFRQNVFSYYADRHFIADIDPRLLEFYHAPDKKVAFAALRRLGIDYVYLPGYDWPSLDRSLIKPIVSDPGFATPVLDQSSFRVYRLRTNAVDKASMSRTN